jgi:hypothetical protein
MAERVAVPRLLSTSPTMWLSILAALVGGLAVVVWGVVTQPPTNQVAALVVLLVVGGLVAFLTGRRTWLDTRTGDVGRDVWGLFPRRTPWAGADRLRVTPNRGGAALLELRGSGHRTSIYFPLVAVDTGGDRSQDPHFLRLLAGQIETWAPERSAVIDGLRAQADHLESGGSVRESPLARRYLARRT